MTQTASKLAASVQRAKTQPASAQETVVEAKPPVATAEQPAAAAAAEKTPRTPVRPASRTKPASKPAAVEDVSRGDHNGGQATFPNRVWPD